MRPSERLLELHEASRQNLERELREATEAISRLLSSRQIMIDAENAMTPREIERELRIQREFEKDRAEWIEDMSLGGRTYKPR